VFYLMTGEMLLAGLLVAVLGFILGAAGALLARLPVAQVKAVSIETALQNAGIAMIVLKLSLPRPAADLAVASPSAQ
jgi:sodium/bile acid cotransporter 3/5